MGRHAADPPGGRAHPRGAAGRRAASSTRRSRLAAAAVCAGLAVLGTSVAASALAEETSAPVGAAAAAGLTSAGTGPTSSSSLTAVASGPGAVPAPAAVALAAAPAPVQVRVPSLGVSSSLVHLGVTADGALEVPQDAAVAGWFASGAAPGAAGPAVIAGHVDSREGPGVFADLRDAAVGAAVEVDREDGSTARFVVTRVQQVAKDAFPTAEVYGPVAGPELRLITCGGTFDEGTRHYEDNVVVYARLV